MLEQAFYHAQEAGVLGIRDGTVKEVVAISIKDEHRCVISVIRREK